MQTVLLNSIKSISLLCWLDLNQTLEIKKNINIPDISSYSEINCCHRRTKKKKNICWVFLFPTFLHSYSSNSPFIPSLLIHILTLLSSDGKLKVCLVVRGHWINHFKQELCWGFRISSVTYFSFLFSTAFPAFPLLFVKEKIGGVRSRVRKCQETSGLVASLQESEWLAFPSWEGWRGCRHFSGAGSGCSSSRRWQCGLCGKGLDDKFPPNVNTDIHPFVPAATERRALPSCMVEPTGYATFLILHPI